MKPKTNLVSWLRDRVRHLRQGKDCNKDHCRKGSRSGSVYSGSSRAGCVLLREDKSTQDSERTYRGAPCGRRGCESSLRHAGANGGECVASNKDGLLTMLMMTIRFSDKSSIRAMSRTAAVQGRWVMAQMYPHDPYYRLFRKPAGVTEMIRRLGYESTQ